MRRLLLLPAVFGLAGCSEPFAVFAGGELAGEEKRPPDQWSGLRDEQIFQLETRPVAPYSVNIWAVGIGDDVYISTQPEGTRWSEHIEADPRVRLRVGNTLYPLRSRLVTGKDERRKVAHRYAEKYGMDPDSNWVSDGLIYGLERR